MDINCYLSTDFSFRQLISIEEDLPATKKELEIAEKELEQVTQSEKVLSIEVSFSCKKFSFLFNTF